MGSNPASRAKQEKSRCLANGVFYAQTVNTPPAERAAIRGLNAEGAEKYKKMGLIVAAKTVITVALAEAPSLSHFVIYAQSLPLTPAIHAPSLHLVTVIPAPNLPQVAVTHAPSLPPVIVIPA